MLRLVTWWKNSYRKVCLLPLIASSNNNPRVICANNASNQSCRIYSREICRIRETVNLIEGVYIKNCGRLTPDNYMMSYDMGCSSWKDENWYRKIPLLLFISLLLRLHQTVREQLKNAYLLTKLLSRVTDNCRKTTSSLLRKYTRIQVYRHYLFQNAKFSESETRRKLWASRNKWCPWINLRAYFSAE